MTNFRHSTPVAIRVVALLAGLALLLLLFAVPAHAAKRPADPVAAALNKAYVRKQVTRPQLLQHRATWSRSSVAAKRSKTWQRRNEVAAVRQYASNLARRGQLTGTRIAGVMLGVHATSYYMHSGRPFPRHEGNYRLPGDVVVYKFYSGRGMQYQPFETFKSGMAYVNKPQPEVEKARAVADRMLDLATSRGTSRVWEYYFRFSGSTSPWTSAISQALGTEFYQRVAINLPEAERAPYLEVSESMARSFLRSTRAGGVYSPQGDGRFYVMYSDAPSERILNGHLQVLKNLTRYDQVTPSAVAKQVLE
ncbi:MAG: D-glucuronyl C5-epimerase domain protein, partial [Thermoleophilia bacterium]|nr:D-glucuronyl C5-epimerase domain protein [Thermoleophilia bacterium]